VALTDDRELHVYIFELVEQNTTNYSSIIDTDDFIDDVEPSAFSENQINILDNKGFLPFNDEILKIKRDPTTSQDVKESLENYNDSGDALSTRIDIGHEESRLINIIDKKQLLLRNRFDESKIIHATKATKYSSTANITAKLEIKYLFNYRQIFEEIDDNSSNYVFRTTLSASTVEKLKFINKIVEIDRQIISDRMKITISLNSVGSVNVSVALNVLPESDVSVTETNLINAVSAYFQKELEYNIATVKAYKDKLEKEYDERKVSFSIPFTAKDVLNTISNRENSQKDFGFVVFDRKNVDDIFETNNLGQNILTSDSEKFVDYGYLLNFKNNVKNELSFSGRRAILPSPSTLFNKRLLNTSFDLYNISSYDVSAYPTAEWQLSSVLEPDGSFTIVSDNFHVGVDMGTNPPSYDLITVGGLVNGETYVFTGVIKCTIPDVSLVGVEIYGKSYTYSDISETKVIGHKFVYNSVSPTKFITVNFVQSGIAGYTPQEFIVNISANSKFVRIEV